VSKIYDIIEKISPSCTPTRALRLNRAKTAPLSSPNEYNRDEALIRQLRRVTERNLTAFDDGFRAAVDMVEHGATLARLKAATGVVSTQWEDTQPIELFEEPTLVDMIAYVEEHHS
jgi:hypothetical protein